MSSKGGVDCFVVIKDYGTVVYKEYFTKATVLVVKADNNSRYEIIIVNQSIDTLSYRVKINICIKKNINIKRFSIYKHLSKHNR